MVAGGSNSLPCFIVLWYSFKGKLYWLRQHKRWDGMLNTCYVGRSGSDSAPCKECKWNFETRVSLCCSFSLSLFRKVLEYLANSRRISLKSGNFKLFTRASLIPCNPWQAVEMSWGMSLKTVTILCINILPW